MINNSFDINKFKPFPTSSGLDDNYTGLYEGRVVRVVQNHSTKYKSILEATDGLNYLVKSKLFYEDKNILVIEHEKIENITYYTEWTKKQKVSAAKAVVELQTELVKKGLYLNDPHSFNITFRYHHPLYFDFGSIKEGEIKPGWWFIKCFCGWTEMDYWDKVLKINIVQKLWLFLGIFFSKSPYNYLLNKLSKFEKGFIEGKLISIIKAKTFLGRATRKIINSFPTVFNNLSNWSDYEQKNPET